MNKIGLVFKREYLSRVRNKTFLLSTFLLPIVIVAFIFGTAYLSIKSRSQNKIAVYDPNNYFKESLKGSDNLKFEFVSNADTASAAYQKKGYTGLLVIPAWDGNSQLNYTIRSPKQLGISATSKIEDKINNAIEDKVLQKQGITGVMLDSLRKSAPKSDYTEITEGKGDAKATSSGLAYGIGFGSGILIYIMMFIYGAMVMRGVMEEKTSRIAEVIVSSVKPFQLMMGKILGIGAVGLTQFLLWLVLIFGLVALSQLFIPQDTMQQVAEAQQNNPMQSGMPGGSAVQTSQNILGALGSANWAKIIPCFLFYFLGGYLFYAALFASVGCMVNEDPQDAQSLMLPIMMPIIFGFIIMQSTIQNPDSSLAFWGSIIPFTSPIVMMARIPSDPPAWQIALSMALLIGGFLGTTWMAGKIYRTGILMYGKKASWKQMMKWVFAKS
jgi:ABC-2 type transport system permease protein